MQVSVFTKINKIYNPPKKVGVDEVLEWVRSGSNGLKSTILQIRATSDSNERSRLKEGLAAVIFSGYCGNPVVKRHRITNKEYTSYRDDESLSEHSGLCVIDLDHLTKGDLKKWIEKFKSNKHVYSCFVSPSGDGLKVLFRIPNDIKMHRSHYRAILKELEGQGLDVDSTSINESRVCFISYDPNVYINKDAVVYEKFMLEPEPEEIIINEGNGLTDFSKLSIAAAMIDTATDGQKHRTLIKAAYLMGGYIASKNVQESDARKMLRDRIKAKNPANLSLAYATIEDGLRDGKEKPIYEIEQIENEFKIKLLRDKYKSEQRGFTFLIDNVKTDDQIMDILENGTEKGKPIGIPSLDMHFRLKNNNFSVFLGHDNIGKSTLVWWLTSVGTALHGWKWLIYSPENDIPKIKIKLMDFFIGKMAKHATKQQRKLAKQLVDNNFYFVRKDKIYNVFEILEFGRIMVDQDPKIKGFLIDPYNSLSLDYKNHGAGLSQYEYHMRAISEIRVFSETHCSVYVNAHSVTESRRMKISENGDIPRPYKAHIDGGAMWANRCDDFYILHRQVKNPETWMYTELHADKIKDTDTGTQVTRGDDEAVKLQFVNNCDFVDPNTQKSPLDEWRKLTFGEGIQETLELNQIPLGDIKTAF